jgi:hypothetical protein
MSISRFFIPDCIKPTFMLSSEEIAGKCGFSSGILYGILASILVFIISLRYYIKETDDDNKRNIKLIGGGLIIFILFSFPSLFSHSSKTLWRGYDNTSRDLRSQGYDRSEIFNILQSFEQRSASINVGGFAGIMMSGKENEEKERKEKERE